MIADYTEYFKLPAPLKVFQPLDFVVIKNDHSKLWKLVQVVNLFEPIESEVKLSKLL